MDMIIIIGLSILYLIEVIMHEKDKKKLKEIKKRYGEE